MTHVLQFTYLGTKYNISWKNIVFTLFHKSFQSQRKAMPKNAQTIAQLHSSHTLIKYAQNSPSQASALREL